ncbi:MAG TPA: RsmE family RNA methyltransferase [Verrucomicrobiae bacterium]|jgi:16S rRNA (uracil1498-N3)-methyltransferase|nr:RsmE family RNA methyltransferase [Verrucomicrobiae bacterium]
MTRRRWIADRVRQDRAYLLGPNALHLSRVLRAKAGQKFDVVADGVLRLGTIVALSAEQVEFQLGPVIASATLSEISVFLSIFKFDRMEWALEKLTELGVTRIQPVIAARTEAHLVKAAEKRLERWQRIVHEAAQQSRRLSPPEMGAPVSLKDIATKTGALSVQGCRVVLSEYEEQVSLKSAVQQCRAPLALAFGPEGGWTREETELLVKNGWMPASLGPTILRAETAAIAAVAVAMALTVHAD